MARRGQSGASLRETTRAQAFLLFGLAATVLLYAIPYGRLIGYPLMLVATAAHEMGHGLAAVLVGGDFHALYIWPDGSGMASWSAAGAGAFRKALVAAGGLLGPAVGAAICFALGTRPDWARFGLFAAAATMLVADLLVVRSLFGWLFLGALAALLAAIVLYAEDWLAQTALLFLGIQLALSVFSRGDYLFTPVATTAQGELPSDVAVMAQGLLLPYWFWGGVCAITSVAVIGVGLAPLLRRS